MTDLLGPASSYATTTRPADDRTFGADDTWFKDCTDEASSDGTKIKAGWLNAMLANMRSAVRGMGVAETNAGDTMLRSALFAARLRQVIAGGSANALTVSFYPTYATYSSAVSFLMVSPYENASGGVTIDVDGLGALPVLLDGEDPPAALFGPGRIHLVAYNLGALHVVSTPSSAMSSAAISPSIVTYATPGTHTWTCPENVSRVRYTITGGGGGGAGVSGAGDNGGSGGAGGTARGWVTVTPGADYTLVVGAGGAAGTTTAGAYSGGDGTASSGFGATASGGDGGTNPGSNPAEGGTGGGATGGDINLQGGDGMDGQVTANDFSPGVGGSSFWGGGGRTSRTGGQPGRAPGSGGGGACSVTNAGGAGAAGIIELELWPGL